MTTTKPLALCSNCQWYEWLEEPKLEGRKGHCTCVSEKADPIRRYGKFTYICPCYNYGWPKQNAAVKEQS